VVPPSSLRANAVVAQSLVLLGVAALAASARTVLPLGTLYPLKTEAAYLLVILATAARVEASHPFATFGAANHVSSVRAALVALVVGLAGEEHTDGIAASVVGVSLLATLLDGVDGPLARRTNMASRFGARFDMEVDAVLILALACLAWRYGKAGWWVLVSGLLRYAFVAAGWVWPWMRGPLTPTLRGKTVCVLQIVVLLVVMTPAITPPASTAIAAAGVLALGWSFAIDTGRLWRQADGRAHLRAPLG
jgi:phosphatidylglycerophosphate synthase